CCARAVEGARCVCFWQCARGGRWISATRPRGRRAAGGLRRGPRVTTAVFVSNEHREPLRVERLALPLPQMSIFRAADGRLWTEAATVAYDPDVKAPAKIDSGPPRQPGSVTRVSGPREDPRANLPARALSAAIRGVTG